MGVGSAALATIISQIVSAILCIVHLTKAPKEYRLVIKDIRFIVNLLKQVISNGYLLEFKTLLLHLQML